MWIRVYLLATLALGACSFSTEIPPDAPGPAITVGFEALTSTADEKSAAHLVKVRLSDVSTQDVTVKYQIENGGTAQPPADFDVVTPELMTIPAGQREVMLEVKVNADVDGTEIDETIKLILVEPKNAVIDVETMRHQVTIRAKALPRVSFEVAGASGQEPNDAIINAVLDDASEFVIMASYTVTGLNATSGLDYTLANGSVMFPAGSKTAPITLDILEDALDEDPEQFSIQLTTSSNSLVDPLKNMYTHTILDDIDLPPEVFFQAATSTFSEAGAAVNIVVQLSAVSGRTITVPYTVDAASSSATGGGTDFTLAATMITIAPGNLTGNIALTIVQDTLDEPNEFVELDMQAATNATNAGQQNHRLQIADDDLVCFGSNATVDVCFDTAPAGTINVAGPIDTDGALCAAIQPVNWTDTQDAACVIAAANITINGASTAFGSRPLVIVAATLLTVNANLDGSSKEGGATNGPGTPPNTCAGNNPDNDNGGAGGGAGGSFQTLGGAGGTGNVGNATGGTPAAVIAAPPARLRTGCAGQRGGNASGSQGGLGGKAGGAIYLVSGGNLTIANNIAIHVSGAGASAGGAKAGGGGGGSGGTLRLFAAGTLSTGSSTKLVANGGGGSGGGTLITGGSPGLDPVPQNENTPAPGGSAGGPTAGAGGFGYAGGTDATAGGNSGAGAGDINNAGGGGGGGGGYLISNKSLGQADVSPAATIVP